MKPRLFLILLVSLISVAVKAQNAAYEQYIAQYSPIAVEQMQRHGIPASITLAQGLLESGAGKSYLATHGNNHFGIKCHEWTGRKQYRDDDATNECFRAYNNARESFEDHSLFLKRKRYERLFSYKTTDYRSWAHGLKACGYATNPAYAQSLIDIIETYRLDRYDGYKPGDSGYIGQATVADGFAVGHSSVPNGFVAGVNNGVPYLFALPNDNFQTISARTGISSRRLTKYNERDKRSTLVPGEIIYLKKKPAKAAKQYKGMVYQVKLGDSFYSISQAFAIRLKSLYKLNGLAPDAPILVGQRLRLR